MKKIVVAGYHGYENAGDDATLITIINNLRKCDESLNIVVLSKNPALTKKNYNVNAIYRFNPLEVVWHIMTGHALVLGGGTLIQDSTSSRSNTYYLGLIQIAKFFFKKVMLYSNGMGPLNNPKNIKKAKRVLNKVDVITLRENYAKEFLDSIEVTKPQIVITADPAFNLAYLLENSEQESLGCKILKNENVDVQKRIIGISIRETNNKEKYIYEVAKIADYVIEKYNVNVVFIPFQYAPDLKISNEVMNVMRNKAYVLTNKYSVKEILNVISNCYMIIGMRLHSIIFSALSNVPVLGISYDPKVKYYLEILNAQNLGEALSLNFDNAQKKIDKQFDDYEALKKNMKVKVDELVENTRQNEELLRKILNKKI